MTIESLVNVLPYAMDGATDNFAITFQYADADDIKVVLVDDTTFATSIPAITTDDPDPITQLGTFTLDAGPIPAGSTLYVYRETAPVQPDDYDLLDEFPGALHEKNLDRRAYAEQDNLKTGKLSVRAPISDPNDLSVLPPWSLRRGKGIRFNDDTGDVELTEGDPDSDGSAAASAAAAEAWALVARQFAEHPEDDDVDGYPGEYSALHWAAKAAASAVAAATWNPASYRTAVDQDVIDDAQDVLIVALDSDKYDSDDLASQAQAEAGTDNTTLMTPLRTAQAIAALVGDSVVLNQQEFTANGNWDNSAEPSGSWVVVEMWGAGGGGGEAQAGGSTAEGGGGGRYAAFLLDRASLFENVPVVIGAGGAGASPSTGSGSGAGAAGGITSFGDIYGARGGNGGDSNIGVGATAASYSIPAFYATPESYVDHSGASPSTPNADGNDSLYGGASGAGSQNTVAVSHTGGVSERLDDGLGEGLGGDFDYTTGPTAGAHACGGAAGRAGQGGAAGGDGYCLVSILR